MKRMSLFSKTAASVLAFSLVSSFASFASSSITLAPTAGAGAWSLSSLNLNSTNEAITGGVLSSGAVSTSVFSSGLNLNDRLSGILVGGNTYSGTSSVPLGSLQLSGNTGRVVKDPTLSPADSRRFLPQIPATADFHPLGAVRELSFTSQISGFAKKDPQAAAQRVDSLVGINSPPAVRGFVEATAAKDPAAAIEWALTLTNQENQGAQRFATLEKGAAEYFRLKTGDARKWVQTVPLTPAEYQKMLLVNSGASIKSGAGTITLNGGNTYSGTISVPSGSLQLSGVGGVLGTGGTLVLTGGTLEQGGTILLTGGTVAPTTTYKLTTSAVVNGTISPSGVVTAPKGAKKTYTITPASGYAVSQVTVDGVQKGAITSFTFEKLNGSHTISATFERLPTFSLTASTVGRGTISPSGVVSVTKGSKKVYTITPATGYVVSKVTVDGVQKGALPSYTFENLSANHTIAATFVAKPSKPSKPSAAPSPGSAYAGSASAYFSVSALRGWQDTGVSVLKGQELGIIALAQAGFDNAGELLGTIVPDGSSPLHTPAFLLGADYKAQTKAGGRLWLRLNEGVAASQGNVGTVSVKIHHSASGE